MPRGCDTRPDEGLVGRLILGHEKWTLSRARPRGDLPPDARCRTPFLRLGGMTMATGAGDVVPVRWWEVPRMATLIWRCIEAPVGLGPAARAPGTVCSPRGPSPPEGGSSRKVIQPYAGPVVSTDAG